MANEVKGTLCKVYIGDDGSPADFISLEGQSECAITLNAEFADTTDKDNSGYRTSLNVLNTFQVTGTMNLRTGSTPAQDRLFAAAHTPGNTVYARAYVDADRYYEFLASVGIDYNGALADVVKVNFTLTAAGNPAAVGF